MSNEEIKIEIENLKNIEMLKLTLPICKGVYAITGNNGVGKSTTLNILAKLVYKGALNSYFRFDGNQSSSITYYYQDKVNRYIRTPQQWIVDTKGSTSSDEIYFKGLYEGSLIYGNRFSDAHKDLLASIRKFKPEDSHCVRADENIIESISKILGNKSDSYKNLYRFRSREYAKQQGFKNTPYFIKNDNEIVHQLTMSSGEFLLIGLLDYIYRRIKYNQINNNTELNILILDEVELALHPSSQNRLIDFLNEIANKYNFCVYFSTHSPQIISKIHPNKIFHIEKKQSGNLEINNPCYPAYATRVLYEPNGFDLVILVEDELAKFIIEKIINDNDINKNKLIKVIPTGGWEKTLELALDFKQNFVLGSQCQIVTILDGDIKTNYEREYSKNSLYESLKKQFLPIPSAEKYLWMNIIENPNDSFIDKLGRRFFQTRSINDILEDYTKNYEKDNNKKKLFNLLKECYKDTGGTEESFKRDICEIIYNELSNTNQLEPIKKMILLY